VNGEFSGVQTRPNAGSRNTPLLPPVFPAMFVAGRPFPSAPAGIDDARVVRGMKNPTPNSISLFGRSVIVAGFQ
jgi:hypothetical protein